KNWDAFEVATMTQAEVDQMEGVIGSFFGEITKAEYLKGVAERGMLGYPISSADDIFHDDQLAARNFWEAVKVPGRDEPVQFPGALARFSEMECRIRRPAPTLGQHNGEVYDREMGLSTERLAQMRAARII
ncbi:MAG TPA: CoA transferase, partial [Terriglobia bacterium]